jgi:hypothetical protein
VAALAPEPRTEPPPQPKRAPRPRPKQDRRPRVRSGVVWIAVVGVLLGGIVFMNVAVLRLNIRLDKLGNDRTQLHNDIAALSSQLSSAQAAARIQAEAQRDLHVVPAGINDVTYIRLPAK